ncbi:S phase cyclin A-associated protein in the endoplasmic reticulum [Dirofilaria immitis]
MSKHIYSGTVYEESSLVTGKKVDDNREKAKQWTYYIETLNRTIDCIYEICHKDQTINGCKEALMYLSNSVRDFESLIKTIKLEQKRRHAVAWEIRKAISPPGKTIVEGPNKKDADTLINMLKLSPVVVHEVVENAGKKLNTRLPQSVPSLFSSTATALQHNEILMDKENHKKGIEMRESQDDDGWRLVTTRHRRRKSAEADSILTNSKEGDHASIAVTASPKKTFMNVYERLSTGVLRPPNLSTRTPTLSESGGRGLMYPRCAMDLPQTKASMAKVAYCRQLLWKKHQSDLAEKMERRRRQDLHSTRKANSVPTLSAINFADPDAVSRSAAAFKNRKKVLKKNGIVGIVKERSTPASFERIEELPSENDEDRENIPANLEESIVIHSNSDYFTHSRSEPPLSELVLPDGIDADDTWRAMTEEEESLVQEEESLKKEIEEEESISVDDELERQVAAEGAALEHLGIQHKCEETIDAELCNNKKVPVTWQDVVNNWKQEMEEYASVSWSEIVEREVTRYRKPGEFVERHEKLSSPSRKRNTESTTKRHQERQRRAEELRQMLQKQKAQRLKELSNKVEEVRRKRAELDERKLEHLQMRMAKAEENRQKSIEEIVKKARDDDVKVMEVQFINTIEADNMRHDVMVRNQEWEQRALIIANERARKSEEKAAKEAAVEERRKIAENQRIEKTREKFEKQELLEAQRNEQEKERTEAARERNKQLNERVAEKKATEAVESEKLMKKIQKKQEETRRRYENTLIQVKHRAVELSSPRSMESIVSLADFSQIPSETPYTSILENVIGGGTSKKCKLCDIPLDSDFFTMSHFLSVSHLSKANIDIRKLTYDCLKTQIDQNVENVNIEASRQFSLGDESEVSKQSTSVKKRRARLRQKIQARAKEYEKVIGKSDLSEVYRISLGKTSIDRPIRDIARILKAMLGDDVIKNRCSGLMTESFQSKIYSNADLHILERSLSEILRALRTSDPQKREILLRAIVQNDFLDILTALISCATNGGTVIPSRTYCKALSTLGELVNIDKFIASKFFFSNRVFALLDAYCIKSKMMIWQFSKDSSYMPTNYESHRLLIESVMLCSTFLCMTSALYPKVKGTISSIAAVFGITDDEIYIKLLLSLIHSNGYNDTLSFLIKHTGTITALPWSVQLDSDAVVIPFMVYIDLILETSEILHLLGYKKRGNEPEETLFEKSPILNTAAPAAIQQLAVRIYSMISADCNSTVTTVSVISGTSYRDEIDVIQLLTTSLFQLWFLFLKREPHEAVKYLDDSELCLRLVHITMTMVAQTEKVVSANTELKSKPGEKRTRNFLHFLIEVIGYFAAASERAKMFCVFGWQRSLLMQLVSLPLGYFSNRELMAILMPTLIAICYQNPIAIDLIKPSLSTKTFAIYLETAHNEQFPESTRFPKKFWSNAINDKLGLYFVDCSMCEEKFLDFTNKMEKELDIEWLESFRRCTVMDTFGSYMDHFEMEQLRSFMRSILEAILRNYKYGADFEISVEEKKRCKLLMQCLVNAANCSENLRSCADEYSEGCLRAILKLDWLQNETFGAVINFSRPENGEMYYQIAFECSILWKQVCRDIKKLDSNKEDMSAKNTNESQNFEALKKAYNKRSWLLAVFAKYLEINDDFLSVCGEITESSSIDTFIDIIDTVIEFGKEGCSIKFAIGNVKYILTFLEKALKKFDTFTKSIEMNEEYREVDNFNNVFRVYILLEMVLKLISLEQYHLVFKGDITTAKLVLHIIEGILYYDYCKYQDEMCTFKSQEKLDSRHRIELLSMDPANINRICNFAIALSTYHDVKLIETMKLSCLELLGILCHENDLNREYFGANGSIPLLLNCLYIRDDHNPLGRLYAIAALRHLVLGYPPNQLRLAQLAKEPSAIIERDGLLRELGLCAIYDQETKKIRLKPLPR